MDPISTAITAALAAGITQGAVSDAFTALKQLIRTKYGKKCKISDAIVHLENEPNSETHHIEIQKQVRAIKADKDTDILEAAQKLSLLITQNEPPIHSKFNIQAEKVQGVIQTDRIDNLTQNFGTMKD